jgi:hypothetical protein
MRLKSVLLSLSIIAALSAGAANAVPVTGTNLVTNGTFEATTNGNNKQLAATPVTSGETTSLTGWTSAQLGNSSYGGYNFVLDSSKITTSASKLALSSYSSTTSHGNVFASDAVYGPGALTQLINGLSIGTAYELTFDYAVGQQAGYTAVNTNNYWLVGFGKDLGSMELASTKPIDIPSGGFSGWQTATMTFTATSTSELLGFLASGGTNGAPPFMLLDNVSMSAKVPEPATLSLMLGGIGLIGFMARRRRNKQA